MLAADPDTLTAHDIASEATWADRYRDSDRNGSRQHYEQTWRWHFVNVELDDPNLDTACFGHPPYRPAPSPQIATTLTAAISGEQRQSWSQGTVSDWAIESFAIARKDAYGLLLEPSTRGVYVLDASYINTATMFGCNSAGLASGLPWCSIERAARRDRTAIADQAKGVA